MKQIKNKLQPELVCYYVLYSTYYQIFMECKMQTDRRRENYLNFSLVMWWYWKKHFCDILKYKHDFSFFDGDDDALSYF